MNAAPPPTVPRPALVLGLAGLIPFAGLALACALAPPPYDDLAHRALTGYGAVILSFMGGCRWGFAAMAARPDYGRLGLSVVPALYAWAAMAGPAPLGLLALGFAALLVADIALTRAGGAPPWWPGLRWPLTLGAVASLLVAVLA